MTRLGKHRACG